MTIFTVDDPDRWNQGHTPNEWERDLLPEPGTSAVHGASRTYDPGNLHPAKNKAPLGIHLHINNSGESTMNTRDLDDLNQQVLQRLDRIERAIAILAGATGEGEEGNEGEGPRASNYEPTPNSSPLAAEAERKDRARHTGDARMRRRLAVADQQCSRVLSSINARNKQHYGLTH